MVEIDNYAKKIIELYTNIVHQYFPDIESSTDIDTNYYCVFNSLFNIKIYIEKDYLDFSLYDEMSCSAPIDMILKTEDFKSIELFNEIELKLVKHFKTINVGVYALNHQIIKSKLRELLNNNLSFNIKVSYDFDVEIVNIEIVSEKVSLLIRFDFRISNGIFIGIYCSDFEKFEEIIEDKYLSIDIIQKYLEKLLENINSL